MGRPFSKHTAELTKRVVALRDKSLKFADIAAELGISESYASLLYKNAMLAIPAEKVVQARARELRLVEDSIKELLDLARDEDKTPRVRVDAYKGILGWSEHRARMEGTNAPVKSQVQVISEDAVDQAIRDLEAKLADNDRPTNTTSAADDEIDASSDA